MQERQTTISHKFSRQLKAAMVKLEDLVSHKSYKVIETQDIMMAVLSVVDTGFAYALGYHSLTRTKLQTELDKSVLVEERTIFDMTDETFEGYRKKQEIKKQVIQTPVELIVEKSSDCFLAECDSYPISEYVKQIFDFAEEMRQQNAPDGVIDSYWLLVGISQSFATNAYHIIYKQHLLTGDNVYSDQTLDAIFTSRKYNYREFTDGKAEKERGLKNRIASNISNKLSDPNYSLLQDIATDITLKAKNSELMEVIGRDDEIRKVEIALTRRDKNNAVLLGEGGVGKSAIVDGIAMRIAAGQVASLAGKRILQFSLNDLYAVLSGDYNKGILRFIEEMKREKDVILFVDEIHMLGRVKYLTDAFKPIMARGDFRIIGATTPTEWDVYLSDDSALVRRFEQVIVDEPSIDATITIVKKASPVYENFHRANFEGESIELAVRLAKKYLPKEKLPDSAFTVIDNAGAMVRIEAEQGVDILEEYQKQVDELKAKLEAAQAIEYNEVEENRIRQELDKLVSEFQKSRNNLTPQTYSLKIDETVIKKVVEQKSGQTVKPEDMIVGKFAEEQERIRLSRLKETLAQKVIGQSAATDVVAEAVIRAKTGFRNPKRPVGVFLFLGTSGVGKTETAKVLSEELTGHSRDLIRFDMSEYQQEHEVSKLIGSPPGYVGYKEGGQLTSAVQTNPNSVLLFDEIEKAHPKVFDLMLQVFDDGHLTDNSGRKVDFSNTLIILTSNLGLAALKQDKTVGFGRKQSSELEEDSIRQHMMEAVGQFFRPELLNRIDEIVTFKPFSEASLLKITKLLLDQEIELIKEQGYHLEFTKGAVKLIAKLTYDPKNGARPIKRGISKLVETPLSEKIIQGLVDKGDKLLVGVKGDGLSFKIIKKEKEEG
ncbi:AAA family ATPase [Streptococcus sp. sy010]|uniref:AAA family ATPase n=1 Tax=Streptococcus sp. sy010 TaxID=2600148 RepID=UPI001647E1D0|nr:ATP-dependent Clp protease ATP-binding subunit [Streptococcus sp. sy010]